MKLAKINKTVFSGNVSDVRIQQGQYGLWGSLTIAIDDGYYKKGDNNQQGEWIERTHFIECNVNANFLKKVPSIAKGDFLELEGKLVLEKWKDNQTGQNRQAVKVEAKDVLTHLEAGFAKQLREQAKQQNNQGNNNYNQAPNNGGYSQNRPNNQQGRGYNQNGQNGGYNQRPNQGRSQPPQNGGYPQQGFDQGPQNGGYQRGYNQGNGNPNGHPQGNPQGYQSSH